ncbi:hypothetical protein [Alteribacter natronophilus]|uniref:hypothetical protein n=1 Tax=Alteribacter natronophilus TaxID=2583810 RepID=UPI00110EF662|nr:hypothetical protein [Alteribacter natronophilus]TMW71187.1 hypothetical protein FGB90_14610 [Alteribacter natronophilus]
MNSIIKITWPSLKEEIKVKLLEDINPDLCEQIKNTLPFESIQSHAVVAGKQMYCPYRLVTRLSDLTYENMNEQPIGRMNIELDFQYLAINYGPMTEPVPALPVGQILEEDIPNLMQVGEKVWNNLLYSDDYLIVHMTLEGRFGDE